MPTKITPSRLDSTKDFSSLVTSAFGQANAAFVKANSAFTQANTPSATANLAYAQANSAFTAANNSTDTWVRTQANNAYDTANSAFTAANNSTDTWVRTQANNAYSTANAAFLQANNSTDSWVRTQANNAYNTANSAESFANGAFVTANSGAAFANAAFITANSGASFANAAFITANASYAWGNHASAGYATITYVGNAIANLVNSAPTTLDTLNELATALGNDANFSTTIATSIGVTNSFANGAFLRANASYDAQNTTASFANASYTTANSGASFANAAFITANASYTAQNTTAGFANASYITANSGASFANSAFITANASYASQNTTASFANGAFDKSNSAASFANGAFVTANAAFNAANNATDSWVRNQANNAYNTANAAFTAANTAGGADTWARAQANAAYNKANTNSGGTLTGYVDVFTGDGSNSAFTLSTTPSDENIIFVSVQGVMQPKTSYSLSGNILTFDSVLPNTSYIEVTTLSGTNISSSSLMYRTYTGDNTATNFTVTSGVNVNNLLVAENGILQRPTTDYTVSGANVVFTTAPATGVDIQVRELVTISAGNSLTWYIANANTTMVASSGYFVDTSTGPKTMTLPAAATLGDTIRFNDLAGTFSANNLTVARNSHNIQGIASDLLVDIDQSSFGLVYSNTTYGWKVLEL